MIIRLLLCFFLIQNMTPDNDDKIPKAYNEFNAFEGFEKCQDSTVLNFDKSYIQSTCPDNKRKNFPIRASVKHFYRDTTNRIAIEVQLFRVKSPEFETCHLYTFINHAALNKNTIYETPLTQYPVENLLIYEILPSTQVGQEEGLFSICFPAPNLLVTFNVRYEDLKQKTAKNELRNLEECRAFIGAFLKMTDQ